MSLQTSAQKLTKPNHHKTNVHTLPNNHTTNTMNVFQSLSPGAHTHQQPTRIWTFVCYPRTSMEPPWDSEFGCDAGTERDNTSPLPELSQEQRRAALATCRRTPRDSTYTHAIGIHPTHITTRATLPRAMKSGVARPAQVLESVSLHIAS